MKKSTAKELASNLLEDCKTATLKPMKLSPSAEQLRKSVESRWVLHEPAKVLLRSVCEALTRSEAAAECIERDGLTVIDSKGCVTPNKMLVVERDARNAYALQLNKLMLILSPEAD